MLCTGTAVAESNEILFKANQTFSSSFKPISTRRFTSQMKTPMKSRPLKKKQKLERQGYPINVYFYRFPPSNIRPPPERAPVEKLF